MRLIETEDGSFTIELAHSGDTYRSRHGAISESRHVFISEGLRPLLPVHPKLNALEVGFGTGLNALLTLIDSIEANRQVCYTTLEIAPVSPEVSEQLNYTQQLNRPDLQSSFHIIHSSPYNHYVELSSTFLFRKMLVSLDKFETTDRFHLVYFDPFSPSSQPELWSLPVFEKLIGLMTPGGILVTYSSNSSVRRTMTAAGFQVTKVPGPRGKREMVRAIKPVNYSE